MLTRSLFLRQPGQNRRRWVVPLLLLLSITQGAVAQRVIAVTSTMNAMRQATRVYLHSVDLPTGQVLPGTVSLPGPEPLTRLVPTATGDRILCTAGTGWRGGSFSDEHGWVWHAALWSSPFFMPPVWRSAGDGGWREWAAATVSDSISGVEYGVFPGVAHIREQGFSGRLALHALPRSHESALVVEANPSWDLPGRPVDAVVLRGGRIVALCARADGGMALTTMELGQPVPGQTVLELPAGSADVTPVSLALSEDGHCLWMLSRGFSLNEDEGMAVAWVHAVDSSTLAALGSPHMLRGVPTEVGRAIQPVQGDKCWVALQIPGTDFATATLVACPSKSGEELVRVREQSLAGVMERFFIAPDATGETLAVAMDRRLELWPEGVRAETHIDFEDHLGVLQWCDAGLLAAEAGRIHLVDPAASRVLQSVQLQSGWVRDLHVLSTALYPADDVDGDGLSAEEERLRATNPLSPDSDADGLPDGSDVVPLRRSPRIEVTPEVVLQGEAAGRQLRALRVDTGAVDAPWRVDFDPDAFPWLVVYPRSGQGTGHVYAGVNPDHYQPGTSPIARLEFRLGGRAATEASHRAAQSVLRVTSGPGALRRILWACDESPSAQTDYSRLRALLSKPPHLFSHRVVDAAYSEDLHGYDVAVVDVRAAAGGILARARVLDFVREGGALLFVGGHVPDTALRDAGRFLGPIGIYLDVRAPLAGLFPGTDTELGRHWARFAIEGGCRLFAEPPFQVVPDGRNEDGAVLAARDYGHGRIAVLAAGSPLGSDSLRDDRHRLFAERLFAWLAEARIEFRDMDGDGLPDATEDSIPLDQGGRPDAADPGETDFLNDDTDDDGIPDGAEDSNRNGRVDEGETDPRNVDSDGDGVFDGADTLPAPGAGMPHIDHVDPPSGPAEGGYWVILSGRNLLPGSVCWFGDQRVGAVRFLDANALEVRVPDGGAAAPGMVPVRVVAGDGVSTGLLPDGFRYSERSVAELSLYWAVKPAWEGLIYRGQLGVRLQSPEGTKLRMARFRILATSLNKVVWQRGGPGAPALPGAGTRVSCWPIAQNNLEAVVFADQADGFNSGDIAVLSWHCPEESLSGMSFQVEPGSTRIVATHGGTLDVSLGPALNVLGGPVWEKRAR